MTRATGRTYRLCLEAIIAASNGNRVLFTVGSREELNNVFYTLTTLTEQHRARISTPDHRITFKHPENKILDREGSIMVALHNSNFIGMRFDLIIEDELLGAGWRDIQKYLINIFNCRK